jgi:hypothetical protein
VTEPAERKASYEDILTLPELLVGEILYGQLYTHPRPSPKHARAYAAVSFPLNSLWA